jgi:hypothetical protein
MCETRSTSKSYQDALWSWRQIKVQCANVARAKEFQVDDTAITAQYIARTLERIEKNIRKGQSFEGDLEGAKKTWFKAGQDWN